MSTVVKVVDRPKDAPKEPVYPRLVTSKLYKRLYWAIGPGKRKGTFSGILVHVFKNQYEKDDPVFSQFERIGYYDDAFETHEFNDFEGAITLYNA